MDIEKLSDDIGDLIKSILNPPEDPKEVQDAREVLLKIKGFNYQTNEDLKDCVDGFLTNWFGNFNISKSEPDNNCITYNLAKLSGKDERDIILDETLMKTFYEYYMCAYNLGALQQKKILKDSFDKICNKGVLVSPKI